MQRQRSSARVEPSDLKAERRRRRHTAFGIKAAGILSFFAIAATWHTGHAPSAPLDTGPVVGALAQEADSAQPLHSRALLDEATPVEYEISCDAVNEHNDVCSFVEVGPSRQEARQCRCPAFRSSPAPVRTNAIQSS